MRIKPGVKIGGASPELAIGLQIMDSVHRELFGKEITVTSICDGKHSIGSLHYRGEAADLRTKDLEPQSRSQLAQALQQALGADWDVVLEKDHIHVEYDPEPS